LVVEAPVKSSNVRLARTPFTNRCLLAVAVGGRLAFQTRVQPLQFAGPASCHPVTSMPPDIVALPFTPT
jgi:hypothetical protein